MNTNYDFIAIGDIVTDAFIRLKQAEVQDSIDHGSKELCVTFGDKVPYEFVKIVKGVGNSANAAVSAARLGLSSALIADVGNDLNGKECIEAIAENKVGTEYIKINDGIDTNYHYVLWYDVERTILVKHQQFPYSLPEFKAPPKWIYLSSLGESSLPYHGLISDYLKRNPEVKLAFQPGTFQMKLGVESLKDVYAHSDIFFCNVEEAKRILKTNEKDLPSEKIEQVKKLMQMLTGLGPKMVVVTDGFDGAYAFDGKENWFMPIYPHTPVERTGAGDAFASTITSVIAMGKTLEEALSWAPINSMSVVQKIGAQEGLLTQPELLAFLAKAPADYKSRKI